MKKAQILSAIALAFALGIVAPVASTYTNVYAATASTDIEKEDAASMQQAVNALKNSFKNVSIYARVGAVATVKKGADAYAAYNGVDTAVDAAGKLVTSLKEIKSNAAGPAKTIRTDLGTAIAGMLPELTTATNNVWTNDLDTLDYTGIVDLAKTIKNELVTAAAGKGSSAADLAAKENILKAVDKVEAVIANAPAVLNTAIENDATVVTTIEGIYTSVTGKALDIKNETQLNDAVKAIKAALPDYDLYVRTKDAVADIEAVFTAAVATFPSHAKVAELLAALKAAIAAPTTPEGPADTETPGDDQNADADAPNTGALLSSDKGATTVSIVAGLATALTALGAGVVAYRNARRSSK